VKYVKTVEEALSFALEEMADVRKKMETDYPTPKKHEVYPRPDILQVQLSYIRNDGTRQESSTWGGSGREVKVEATKEAVKARQQALLAAIDRETAAVQSIRQQNVAISRHNTMVRDKIKMIMTQMGIPESYGRTVYKRNKATTETSQAGYLGDLMRFVPSHDGYGAFETAMKAKADEINRWAMRLLEQYVAEETAAQEAEKARQLSNFLATMRVKYSLDFDADNEAIRKAIIASNPYLTLADVGRRQGMTTALLGFTEQGTQADEVRDYFDGDYQSGPAFAYLFKIAAIVDTASAMDYDAYLKIMG
jgi:hypothetical protein